MDPLFVRTKNYTKSYLCDCSIQDFTIHFQASSIHAPSMKQRIHSHIFHSPQGTITDFFCTFNVCTNIIPCIKRCRKCSVFYSHGNTMNDSIAPAIFSVHLQSPQFSSFVGVCVPNPRSPPQRNVLVDPFSCRPFHLFS